MKNSENKMIQPEKWLEICAIFSRDGVEEMMKISSCFIIVFHVDN